MREECYLANTHSQIRRAEGLSMTVFTETYKELLAQIRSNTFCLETLSLNDIELNSIVDLSILVEALKQNTHIRTLSLCKNSIDDQGAAILAGLGIGCGSSVCTLLLSGNAIGTQGAQALAAGRFGKLTLDGNPIGDLGLGYFASHETLLDLSVEECDITDQGVIQILKSPTLKILHLAANNLTSAALQDIPSNHQLEQIYLDRNLIDSLGGYYLGRNDSLRILSVANNQLGDEGAIGLTHSPSLELLGLAENGIGDPGAIALASHKKSKILSLLHNKVRYDGAIALLASPNLERLILSFNQVTGELADITSRNQRNILVELAGNPICTTFSIKTKKPLEKSSPGLAQKSPKKLFT